MSSVAIREVEDRLYVTLDRPEIRNAIDETMAEELHDVCARLERDPKVLILTGASTPERGVFASGADIRQLIDRRREQALRGINSTLFTRVARLPMPVIAAIDGYAIGAGAELAYAADFRLASTRAVFGNPETGLGILAAAGATWRLLELVGEPLAKEVLLAGRTLTASEALSVGLVTSVHEPESLIAAADDLADRIGRQDPLAIRLTKRVLASPREAHPAIDEIAQAVLFESEAKTARMTAFLNRKKKER